MQRDRSIHQDLLAQVADSTHERDEVRRILGEHRAPALTEAALTKHNARRMAAVESAIARTESSAAPFGTVATASRRDSESVLSGGMPGLDTRRTYPRTLRDVESFRDPSWRTGWQSAEAAAAEEEHIRAQFNDSREPLGWRVANWTVGMALCALALMTVMGWLPGR